MKYLEKYNRYIDNDYVIYRTDREGKLVQVKPSVSSKCRYEFICYAYRKTVYVHRLVYEAFIGEIPEGMEIDHINCIRTDNRLENLRCVTHSENMNNPLTKLKRISGGRRRGEKFSEEHRKKLGAAHKGKPHPRKPSSEFGKKYFEHYGYSQRENKKQYKREHNWFYSHNHKCSWE